MLAENYEITNKIHEDHIEVLLTEYQTVLERIDRFDDRTFQFIGIGVPVLGVLTGYMIQNMQTIPFWIAVLAPVLYIIFLTVIVYGLYQSQSCAGICRALTIRINKKLSEPAVISYEPDLPPGLFFSTKRGNLKFRIVPQLIIAGATILWATILILSFTIIYQQGPRYALIFALAYSLPTLALAYAFSGILVDVSDAYRDFVKYIDEKGVIPRGSQYSSNEYGYERLLGPTTKSLGGLGGLESLLYNLIPRPLDILMKMHGFWWGFSAAYVMHGLDPSQLDLLNNVLAIQSKPDQWKLPTDVPFTIIFILGIMYFIVQEFLLQQAKLLWDDIRDQERDKGLEFNQFRGIIRKKVSATSAKWSMAIRWTLAFIISWFLGGSSLLILYAIISVHQVIYVLFAKDRDIASKYPLIPLFILAPNVAFRFIGGLMSVAGGSAWLQFPFPFAIMFAAFFLLTIGTSSAQWKMEAQNQELKWNELDLGERQSVAKQKFIQIRPQSDWYLQNGNYWQRVGFISMVLCSIIGFVLAWFTQGCNHNSPLFAYDFCSNHLRGQLVLFIVIIIALIVSSIILVLISTKIIMSMQWLAYQIKYLIMRKKGHHGRIQQKDNHIFLVWAKKSLSLLFPISIFASIFAVYSAQPLTFLGGFLLMSICLLIDHENKTYAEMTFEKLRKDLPFIVNGLVIFLFTQKLTLSDLLNIEKLKKKLPSANEY